MRARALSAAAQEASALHKILSRTRASALREFLWRTRAGERGRFRLRLRKRCHYTGFFRGRGRPRYVSLFGGQGHGERGRFRLRLRKRCHYTGFFRGRGRPRYASIFGGRGLGGRGRPPHIPHIGIFEVGGGPGFVADDPFGNAEQIYSDIPVIWLKAGAAQVGGGDLQSIAAGRRLWCPPGGRRSCA